jgi:hypothetical protein
MNRPPEELDDARVLCFAAISGSVKPTGATAHYSNGQVQGPARALAICQYAGSDHDFYLFYCDEAWVVMNDTWHSTLEQAKQQAEREYEGISVRWQDVSSFPKSDLGTP